MTPDEIRKRHQEIVDADGPWTAHNIELCEGFFTRGIDNRWFENRGNFLVYLAEEALQMPASKMRVLDLGSLEGEMSVQFARHGAQVIGLEIRDVHLTKANFAKEALNLDNLTFVKGDMLKLDECNLGEFDVVVCAGVLYHVDASDLETFLSSLRKSCRGVLLVDTHIAREIKEQYTTKGGLAIYGRSIVEHTPEGQHSKEARLWSSADNNYAFWPSEQSLAHLLLRVGFFSVSRPILPCMEWPWKDRGHWVAKVQGFSKIPVVFRTLWDPDTRPERHPLFDNEEQRHIDNPQTVAIKPQPEPVQGNRARGIFRIGRK